MNTKNSLIPIKRYKSVLSAVHMVYRLVNVTFNVQELALRLTRMLSQFIIANTMNIYLLDSRRKKVELIAGFDNKINILKIKKSELKSISEKEIKVVEGFPVYEKHFMGIPLVAEDNVGAIFVRRDESEEAFDEFDREMLTVFAELSVTAIKYLQMHDEQQRIILGSIEFIGKLLKRPGSYANPTTHSPVYFKIVQSLAQELEVREDGLKNLYYASILHDAGAMDVPYEILSKTSRLTSEDFKVIRNHPKRCVELMKQVKYLQPVLPIVLYRREKYDGTGYPAKLKKEQIPLGARIMAVADAFEAMTQKRVYKKRLSIAEAINELKKNSGTQFDPKVVDIFVNLSKQKKFKNYLSCTAE